MLLLLVRRVPFSLGLTRIEVMPFIGPGRLHWDWQAQRPCLLYWGWQTQGHAVLIGADRHISHAFITGPKRPHWTYGIFIITWPINIWMSVQQLLKVNYLRFIVLRSYLCVLRVVSLKEKVDFHSLTWQSSTWHGTVPTSSIMMPQLPSCSPTITQPSCHLRWILYGWLGFQVKGLIEGLYSLASYCSLKEHQIIIQTILVSARGKDAIRSHSALCSSDAPAWICFSLLRDCHHHEDDNTEYRLCAFFNTTLSNSLCGGVYCLWTALPWP